MSIIVFFVVLNIAFWIPILWRSYRRDGQIILTHQEDKTVFMLELNVEPEVLMTRKEIRFKVVVAENSPEEIADPQE